MIAADKKMAVRTENDGADTAVPHLSQAGCEVLKSAVPVPCQGRAREDPEVTVDVALHAPDVVSRQPRRVQGGENIKMDAVEPCDTLAGREPEVAAWTVHELDKNKKQRNQHSIGGR